MSSLAGKRALILGVANERSIAWAIAKQLSSEGCRLGLTFLGEALERRVRPLAAEIGAELVLPCDVGDDGQIETLFTQVGRHWEGGLDILVHAVAFANREDLARRFVDTGRDGFRLALDVSAYSLVALTRGALPLFRAAGGGSVLTLSFAGSVRVFPNYNVMGVAKAALESCVRYLAADVGSEGVRVNAISAGPIKTLSAAGIRDFRSMLHVAEERAPLKRNVSAEEVAATAAMLLGPAGGAVTGQVVYVDAGLSILGV
jgi:enoyl-[acyl-carrier protein] reductase I